MAQLNDGQAGQPGRFRLPGFVQAALILAAIIAALYFARAPGHVQIDTSSGLSFDAAKPVVQVVKPETVDQSIKLKLTGAVTLEEQTGIVAEVTGRVSWISPNFNNGGVIPANEKFVQIDPTEYELEVKAAANAVSEAAVRLQIEEARGNALRIALAEAQLASAKTGLELARLQLERTSISLPYESRVISTELEIGEVVGPHRDVGPGGRIGTVYRVDALQFEAPMEVSSLGYLSPLKGRTAIVRTEVGTHRLEATRVSSMVAPSSRLATVFFRFASNQTVASLPLPGSFGEGEIEGPAYENVYTLPEAAIQEQNRVWVVRDGELTSFTPTALGRVENGLVVEAFDAGEGVVFGILPEAREGLAVTIAEAVSSE